MLIQTARQSDEKLQTAPFRKSRESSLNGFYWFNLQSFSISLQTMHISEKGCSSHYQPVSRAHAQGFCFSHGVITPWIQGSPLAPRCWVIIGNKELADDWTGRQKLWVLYISETTSWQSTLIFIEEFFRINGQPLCSLSEVFLIIRIFCARVSVLKIY